MPKSEPRYKKLEKPKQASRKPKRSGGNGLRNLIVLAAVIFGGSYLIPADDRDQIIEQIVGTSGTIPGEGEAEGGNDLYAMIASIFGIGDPGPKVARIDIKSFAPAYDSWQRTDYLSTDTAGQAMRHMDRMLKSEPVQIFEQAEVSARTAAIYRQSSMQLLFFVEAAAPPKELTIQPELVAEVNPGEPVVLRASGVVEDAPVVEETVVTDATETAEAAEPEPELPIIEIEGIAFADHSDGREGIVDLRAELPSKRSIYVRGRAPMAVVEEFLSMTNLDRMGLRS